MNGRARLAMTLIGITPLIAASAAPAVRLQPESKVSVTGGSTVRDWSCSAAQVSGVIEGEGGLAIGQLEQTIRGAEITIPVRGLECGNGTMNEHLRKALKSTDNPTIRFELSGHRVTAASDAEGVVRMTGKLQIAGQEKAVQIDATARRDANGTLRVSGSEEILMSEFGVKPPTLMMGTLKVKDRVVVRFDVALKS